MPDSIILGPQSRAFDLVMIRKRLLAHPAVVADPLNDTQLLVAANKDSRAHAVKRRRDSPKHSIARRAVVLAEGLIEFPIDWIGSDDLSIARDLAAWVVAEYQPRIFSEVVGDDWTERCSEGLEPMFPSDIPLLPRGQWLEPAGR